MEDTISWLEGLGLAIEFDELDRCMRETELHESYDFDSPFEVMALLDSLYGFDGDPVGQSKRSKRDGAIAFNEFHEAPADALLHRLSQLDLSTSPDALEALDDIDSFAEYLRTLTQMSVHVAGTDTYAIVLLRDSKMAVDLARANEEG